MYLTEWDASDEVSRNVLRGVRLDPGDQPVVSRYADAAERKTDVLGGFASPEHVSEPFRRLLVEQRVTHVQLLPIQLICNANGEPDETYWLLNPLDDVPASIGGDRAPTSTRTAT